MKALFLEAGVLGLTAILAACSPNSPAQPPKIAEADLTDVLVKSLEAASAKLPKSFCLSPGLSKEGTILNPTTVDAGGWTIPKPPEKTKYRLIPSPDLQTLPEAALLAFGKARVRTDCRHTLVLEKPTFMEVAYPTVTNLEAVVSISDECPVCGGGYSVTLKKVGKVWEIVPDGFQGTWIS